MTPASFLTRIASVTSMMAAFPAEVRSPWSAVHGNEPPVFAADEPELFHESYLRRTARPVALGPGARGHRDACRLPAVQLFLARRFSLGYGRCREGTELHGGWGSGLLRSGRFA